MTGEPIRSRKADHIKICVEERIAPDHCYWDDVRLVHNAMPEINMDDIDMSATVLGKKLEFPFIVTAITGGFSGAKKINANIAEACAELGIGMGVGSERAGVTGVDPESYSIIKDYDVPLVIGNVGAPQLGKQKSKDMFSAEMPITWRYTSTSCRRSCSPRATATEKVSGTPSATWRGSTPSSSRRRVPASMPSPPRG